MSRLRRVVAVACIAASTAAVCVSDPAFAASPAPAAKATRYTVQNGDYLSGIASRLGVKLYALLDTNHLQVSSLIYAGMQLTVPKGGRLPAPQSTGNSTGGRVHTSGTPTVRSNHKYVVVANDSLSGIASTLGVTMYALLAENQLEVTSLIYPGMLLSVPRGGTLPSATPATPQSKPATRPTVHRPVAKPVSSPKAPLVYVVLSGDALSLIAQRLGVTLGALLATNDMTVSSFIYPGMRLTVPKGGSLPKPTATPTSTPTNPSKSTGDTSSSTTTVVVPTPSATPKVSAKLQPMMNFAMAQQGKPYKFNTAGPNTYDCSGLAMAAYAEIGISLPHFSGAQALLGTAIDWTKEAIRPGDLVFLESSKGSGIVDHVGIAISATKWLHAPRTGDVVRTGNIPMFRVVAVRRLVTP